MPPRYPLSCGACCKLPLVRGFIRTRRFSEVLCLRQHQNISRKISLFRGSCSRKEGHARSERLSAHQMKLLSKYNCTFCTYVMHSPLLLLHISIHTYIIDELCKSSSLELRYASIRGATADLPFFKIFSTRLQSSQEICTFYVILK